VVVQAPVALLQTAHSAWAVVVAVVVATLHSHTLRATLLARLPSRFLPVVQVAQALRVRATVTMELTARTRPSAHISPQTVVSRVRAVHHPRQPATVARVV
jgi:hypothetical protein